MYVHEQTCNNFPLILKLAPTCECPIHEFPARQDFPLAPLPGHDMGMLTHGQSMVNDSECTL